MAVKSHEPESKCRVAKYEKTEVGVQGNTLVEDCESRRLRVSFAETVHFT